MISKDELLKGRDKQYPDDYSDEISANLDELLIQLNQIRSAYGKPMIVSSGWRPPSINGSTPGAAAHSKHMDGLAADIQDLDGSLWSWVLKNLQLMQDLGIYMEHKWWTSSDDNGGWVHFGLGAPKSGKRIFIPSTDRPHSKKWWNGEYDHAFDD